MIYETLAVVFAIVIFLLVDHLLFADDDVTITQIVMIEALLMAAYLAVLVVYFIATGQIQC